MTELKLQTYRMDQSAPMGQIRAFLAQQNLGIDPDVTLFDVIWDADKIVACGGLADNVLKSIAVDETYQGQGLSLKLLTDLTNQAYSQGLFHLFIYTKPRNTKLFTQAGFHPLVSFADKVVLMENSSTRLKKYCQYLSGFRHSGDKIGGIVMNANPFTLGHQYLLEQVSKQVDWLHLIVVKEDKSYFSFSDRFAMIQQGCAHIHNITVHSGSDYVISRATFPSYFLKDEQIINSSHTAIDLQLFRNYIAPALGITHRFAGSEPTDITTRFYNEQMQFWLQTPKLTSPAIEFVELHVQLSMIALFQHL